MKELQDQAKRLRRQNDQLRAQIEKSRKYTQDNCRDMQLIASNKGKGPVVLDDFDTPTNDELSLGSPPSLNLLLTKNTWESTRTRSRKRPSPHLAFSDAVNGASRRARREAGRRQYRPCQALENPQMLPSGTMPLVPPTYLAFGTTPTFYVPPAALIRRPDNMLSSPLRQHILDYESPRGFAIPTFTTFDGSANPYDHMLHYNQVMMLNANNDRLLCKVLLACLRGPALAWFHKLSSNSINSFNELWAALISQYLCSVRQKRNISSLQTILKQEEESRRDFTRRFGQPVQQVEAYSMDAILQNFTRSFGPSTPFFHSLSLDSPVTMEELYRRTNSYSMLEDNIHAATQTIMIISHWLRATSQRGRSRLSPRNFIVETERDLVISHRKRGGSRIHPPP